MNEETKLKKALLKKALGYDANEIVEEYVLDEEGNERLSKKKVTRKHYSPDITAMKVLFDKYIRTYGEDVSQMTDEELIQEKERLLKLLKEEKNETFEN